MTKKELIEYLSLWPDDADIEISIDPNADMMSEGNEGRIWYELTNVEQPCSPHPTDNVHCLLIGGKVTMC